MLLLLLSQITPSSARRARSSARHAQLAEHRLGVRRRPSSAPACRIAPGRAGQLRHDAGRGHLPVHLVLVLDEQPALAEVRVGGDVGGRVDRRADHAGRR